jgi:platelet-activating factor acetylhydrolase IB subunit alpha
VSFSPTGSHLASCSTDLSIKLWDFTDFVCLRTLRGHDHTISSVIFLPQESIFAEAMAASASNGGKNTITTTGGGGGSSSTIAATAGAQCLLSASRDQTVKLWDIETGFCDHTYTDHGDWVRCLAARHSSGTGGSIWASAGNDPMICVYDYKTKIAELRGHEHVVEALAFITEEPFKESGVSLSKSSATVPASNSSGPGNASTKQNELLHDYLASGSRDRTVRLWRVSEQACLAVFRAHENWVRSVLIHPSGNYIISSSDDKSIRVFDIKAVRCLRTLDNAHDHFVTSLHMHHTLPILVSGSVDQTVRCWQLD